MKRREFIKGSLALAVAVGAGQVGVASHDVESAFVARVLYQAERRGCVTVEDLAQLTCHSNVPVYALLSCRLGGEPAQVKALAERWELNPADLRAVLEKEAWAVRYA